jgi:hypothetical protein
MNSKSIVLSLSVAIGLAATVCLIAPPGETAQDDLKINSIYTCEDNSQFKVLSCDGNMCKVFVVNKFSPGGGEVMNQSRSTTLAVISSRQCKSDAPPIKTNVTKRDAPQDNQEPAETKPSKSSTGVGPIGAGGPKYGFEYNVLYTCSTSEEKAKILSCDAKGSCKVWVPNPYRADGGEIQTWPKGTVESWIERFTCSPEGKQYEGPQSEGCSSDAGVADGPKSGPPSEPAFKNAIFRELKSSRVNRPVGIKFESFQIGTPRINRPDNMAYIAGFPVGTRVYPVSATINECTVQSNGEIIRQKGEARYDCGKNQFGEWSCGGASGSNLKQTSERPRPPKP